MAVPSSVANMIPRPATSNVLVRPTQKARPKVEDCAEYSIRVWLMSNPAVTFQKPKPDVILAWARLSAALRTAAQASRPSAAHSTTWYATARSFGSR